MIRKTYSPKGKSCRVTFELPGELVAEEAVVVGDFNEWDGDATPLNKRKKGTWSTTVSLKPGNIYQFRYLVDGKEWRNDDEADNYVPNRFGSKNSVLEV